MRNSTIIMGSVAIAVCLVAAALVIAANRSEAPARNVIVSGHNSSSHSAPPVAEASSNLKPCGSGSFSVEGKGASCSFGRSVVQTYREVKTSNFSAYDPHTNKEYEIHCEITAPISCRGDNGVTVYFGP